MTNERITYVSYKTAILAREKGFTWDCKKFFNSVNNRAGHSRFGFVRNDRKATARPSQSVLQKWLREVHQINTLMSFKPNVKKWDFIVSDMKLNGRDWVIFYRKYYKDRMIRRFDTYERSLEHALVEGLNKIEL